MTQNEHEQTNVETPTNSTTHKQHRETMKDKDGGSLWELLKFALIALIIVIPIRAFVAQPFIVSGTSMVPTFQDKQYLIVDEISYRFEKPQRGDIIVFHPPQDPSVYYIKRIIGLPGETISIQNGVVTIFNVEYPNGLILNEPYISAVTNGSVHETLGPTDYFVMGDNRPYSSDSRSWGVLPAGNIVGRVFLRLLPIKNIGVLPGEDHNY